jgi:hypothetical protein
MTIETHSNSSHDQASLQVAQLRPRLIQGVGIPFIKFGRFKRFDPKEHQSVGAENKIDPDEIKEGLR